MTKLIRNDRFVGLRVPAALADRVLAATDTRSLSKFVRAAMEEKIEREIDHNQS